MDVQEIAYLDPARVRLTRPEGSVRPTYSPEGGEPVVGVQIRRAFPLSQPDGYYSIADGEGKEIGVLETAEGLDEESRRCLADELDRRYFTPVIERIHVARFEAGMWRFHVATGRGETQFFVRNWRDSAFETKPGRWMIHSVDGGRFEIVDLEALDEGSRKLMDQLL